MLDFLFFFFFPKRKYNPLRLRNKDVLNLLLRNDYRQIFTQFKTLTFSEEQMRCILIGTFGFPQSQTTHAILILLFNRQNLLPQKVGHTYHEDKLLTSFFDFNLFPIIIEFELDHLIEPLFKIQETHKIHQTVFLDRSKMNQFHKIISNFSPSQTSMLEKCLLRFFQAFFSAPSPNFYTIAPLHHSFYKVFSFFLLQFNPSAFLPLLIQLTDDELILLYGNLYNHLVLMFSDDSDIVDLTDLFSIPQLAACAFKANHPLFLQYCDIPSLRIQYPQYLIF